jgi:hypothetical protein
MGYYQGDYYAGAMGDPFWGALVGIARKGIGALVGAARGRGAPAAAGVASTAITKVTAAGRAIIQRGTAQIIKHPVLSAAGAAGVVGAAIGAGGEALMHPGMGGACVKGFHMSKPKGGRCSSAPHLVRNRRMNVANGRALSRAVRRLHHFARKYRKVVGFVSPRKPKGRMYFRKRKAHK